MSVEQTVYDTLYLVTCALNGTVPDVDRVSRMDLGRLFRVCQFHSLTATVGVALESAGVEDPRFIEAKYKAIRKAVMLDAGRRSLCEYMEQNGIWYVPLKGIVLEELYPRVGMRQMADNDILYDARHQLRVKEYMQSVGYTAKSVGRGNHDVYVKPPVYNYELHTSLFGESHGRRLYEYYGSVHRLLVKDEGSDYAYHLTDEDFYVYTTAHEYKHYSGGGTGLRSLVDRYVYLRAKGGSMDWEYVLEQLDRLGIADFEERSRSLAYRVFSSTALPELSDGEGRTLEYYASSGTYGTYRNSVRNGLDRYGGSKPKYLLSRLFPPMEFYRLNYPFFYRHRALLPALWAFRTVRGCTAHRRKVWHEVETVRDYRA